MDAKIFGAFVAKCRKRKGMTQAELAMELNVTDKAVSRWERGVGFPDISTIEPLAATLEVSIMDIMGSKQNETAKEDKDEYLFTVTNNYFWPRQAFIRPHAVSKLPEYMQEHINNGGKVYIVREPKDGKAFIGMAEDRNCDYVVIDMEDTARKLRRMERDDIEELPEPMRTHALNGGAIYVLGDARDGRVITSTSIGPDGYTMECKYYEFADRPDTENRPIRIGIILRRCMGAICNKTVSDREKREKATLMRNYLVHCLKLEELDGLTAIYRDKVRDDLATGYDPTAVKDFVLKLNEEYPREAVPSFRYTCHKHQIYREIGAILTDCISTLDNTKDNQDDETYKETVTIFRNTLRDCLKFDGMSYLTRIYRDKAEDNEIGYNMEAALDFVDQLVGRYGLPTEEKKAVDEPEDKNKPEDGRE